MHYQAQRPNSRPRGSRRLTFGAAAAAGIMMFAAACGGSGADERPDGSLIFADGDPVLQVDTASFTSVPQAMNFWSDQGLDVEVQPTAGSPDSVALLSSGKADIALVGTTALYSAMISDPDLRLIWFQRANIWRIATNDPSIKRIEDLKGKRVGVQSLSSGSYLFGRAAVAAAGLDPETDIEWIPIGVAAQAATAVDNGDVDAVASYDGPVDVVSGLAEQPLTQIDTPLDEVHGTLALATTADYLKDHREDVVKFVRGFDKGAVFAANNMPAAMNIHWDVYPDQKPAGEDPAQLVKDTMPSVKARYSQLVVTKGNLGYLSLDEVQESIDFLAEHGLIEKHVDADDVYVDGIAEEADDFNHDEIARAPKAHK